MNISTNFTDPVFLAYLGRVVAGCQAANNQQTELAVEADSKVLQNASLAGEIDTKHSAASQQGTTASVMRCPAVANIVAPKARPRVSNIDGKWEDWMQACIDSSCHRMAKEYHANRTYTHLFD